MRKQTLQANTNMEVRFYQKTHRLSEKYQVINSLKKVLDAVPECLKQKKCMINECAIGKLLRIADSRLRRWKSQP